MDQLALHVRFVNASQEPLWARNMHPLRLPDPCPLAHTPVVVCKVSGPPVLYYAYNWLWGPRCSATHTSRGYSRRALLALGLRWLSCIPCPRPILQNCRHHETQNLSHHRHRPTVRNYTNYSGHQQLHQPAKPHRHKQRPATHHHGRGPCKCIFLLALNRHTHPSRGPPFAWSPLGSPHINRCLRGADGKTPLKRLKGYERNKPMVEFGEQVWAKPLRTQAWGKREPPESKWNAATWVGVSGRTGERLVILPNGGPLLRVRTVKRRPVEERWCAEAIAEIGAGPRKPEPDKREGLLPRRINTKDAPSEEDQRKSGVLLDTLKLQRPRQKCGEFRITHVLVGKYGKTEGCPVCLFHEGRPMANHSLECRQRF